MRGELGRELLRVAVHACKLQVNSKGYFILEHPQNATSWQTEEMQKLLKLPGV